MLRKKFAFIILLAPFFLFLPSTRLTVFSQVPSNFAGVGVDPTNPGGQPNPADLKDMGVGMVRVVYRDDASTNDYISNLVNNGITPVLVLNWEANDSVWNVGGDMTSYANTFQSSVVQPAVNKYGNNVVYQVWNEPDGVEGTKPLSAQQYYTLLSATYNTIKNNSETNKVITAGLVSGDMGYVAQLMALSGGNHLPADGIGYHPYVYDIDAVRNGILNLANGTGLPIWITEFGLGTSDQQRQAEWIRSVFGLSGDSSLSGVLQSIMWYAWSDAMNDGFGLVDADGNPKQELIAFLEAILGDLPEGFLDRFDFSPINMDPIAAALGVIDSGETMLEPVIFLGERPDADYARTWTVNYLETANILDIGNSTAVHFENINLPLNPNYTKREKSTGHVRFLYCREGAAEFPRPVEGIVYFEVPAYYSQAALSTYQVSDMMTYPDQRAAQTPNLASIGIPNNISQKDGLKKEDPEAVLASFPRQVLAQSNSNCPDIGYSTWVENGQLCWEIKGTIGSGLDACDWGYEVLIDGQPVAGVPIIGGANNCLVKEEEQTRINCYMGGTAPVPFSGNGQVSLNITQLQYSQGIDCRPSMYRENICEVQDDGTVVCTNSEGQVIERPQAPPCYAGSYTTGERLPVPNEPVVTSGLAKIAAGILSRWEEFWGTVDGIEKWLKDIFGVGDRYVIFPIITHPYTNASEIKYRQDFSAPFTLPGEGKNQKHAEVDIEFAEQSQDDAAVYGQKGWYDAYEYDTDMVSLPD